MRGFLFVVGRSVIRSLYVWMSWYGIIVCIWVRRSLVVLFVRSVLCGVII